MNIAILTSGHPPLDERIFYKFGQSLKEAGYNVGIICSTQAIEKEIDGIFVRGFNGDFLKKRDKLKNFYDQLILFKPYIIICCEPLTILAAYKYKRNYNKNLKIISDVTEYYPHQNTLNKYRRTFRLINFLRYFFFNVYVSNLADYLFIGEFRKARIYRIITPLIKKTIIGYYPPKKYFKYYPPNYNGKTFTICYTGIISEERGFEKFLILSKIAAERFPDKNFNIKIIGPYSQKKLEVLTDKIKSVRNITVIYKQWVDYKLFSDEFKDVDICVDLREKNKTYNQSLPIKVFDYMACGKPVIYSNLASFKEFEDVKLFGRLIEPTDFESALQAIRSYLDNPEKLKSDSITARRLFEDKYNWENIEGKFLGIIKGLIAI